MVGSRSLRKYAWSRVSTIGALFGLVCMFGAMGTICIGPSTPPCDADDFEGCAEGLECFNIEGVAECRVPCGADDDPEDVCDDDDACTEDSCNEGGYCDNTAMECPEGEVCEGGECVPACVDDADCDDGSDCTTDTCDTDTGLCSNPEDVCGEDEQCVDGVCEADPCADKVCDDDNECTDDACDPTTGDCEFTNNDAACDDGDACTENDACAGGACTGSAKECPEGEACVEGDCIPDLCVDVTCEDGNECTDDTCDPTTGECEFPNNADACDDGDLCTENDACADGACAGSEIDCPEGESCVDGECVETPACVVDDDCDDEVWCNGAETCVAEECVPGTDRCDPDIEICNEELQDCDPRNVGETFNFTTDIDDLVGTGLADTFRGVTATTGGTLTAGDAANGGAGTDTLKAFLTDANLTAGISVDNVELILVQNTTGTARTVSVLGWTGVEALWSDNSLGALTFSGMDALMTVGLLNTSQDVTATFNNSALTGTETANVELDGAQNGADVVIGSTGVDGVETIVINSGGDGANRIDGIDDGGENDFATLTLTGDQNLRIDGPIGTSVKTVDASALTGAADVSVAGLTAFTFTGTAQDDTIRASNIGATDTINGGDGTGDSLIVSGTFGTTTIADVESLTLKPTAATPAFDLTNAPDITAVSVEPTVAITDLSGAGLPPAETVTISSDLGVTLGGAASAFTLKTPTGATDSLGLVFTGNANVSFGGGNVAATGFESFSLTFNNNGTLTFAAGAGITDAGNTLKKVTLAGNGAVNTSGLAALLTTSTAFDETDATGVTGTFTTAAANFPGTAMKITSGGGNDVIVTGAGATTVNGGVGNDTITGGAGADIIDGAAGVDTITGGAGADTVTGGTDNDTFVMVVADVGDTITDFTTGSDDFDWNTALSSIDASVVVPNFVSFAAGDALSATGTVHELTGTTVVTQTAANVVTALGASATNADINANVLFVIYTTGGGGAVWNWINASVNVDAGELTLVATLSGVVADALVAGDFP